MRSDSVHKDVIEGFRAEFMTSEINEPRKRQFNAMCDQALRATDWRPTTQPPEGSGARWILYWHAGTLAPGCQWWIVNHSEFGHGVTKWAELPKHGHDD